VEIMQCKGETGAITSRGNGRVLAMKVGIHQYEKKASHNGLTAGLSNCLSS
jgi:hypothetical protein